MYLYIFAYLCARHLLREALVRLFGTLCSRRSLAVMAMVVVVASPRQERARERSQGPTRDLLFSGVVHDPEFELAHSWTSAAAEARPIGRLPCFPCFLARTSSCCPTRYPHSGGGGSVMMGIGIEMIDPNPQGEEIPRKPAGRVRVGALPQHGARVVVVLVTQWGGGNVALADHARRGRHI